METIFQEEDIVLVKNALNIDMQEIINRFLPYDNFYYFLSNRDDSFDARIFEDGWRSLVRNIDLDGEVSFITSRIPKDNDTLQSLLYYHRIEKRLIKEMISSNTALGFLPNYLNSLQMFLMSLYNTLCSLWEKARRITGDISDVVLIFEACPSTSKDIRSREEARLIRKILSKTTHLPIVRYGTNYKIFKKTCLNNENIRDIHFVCHGTEHGDLILCSDDKSKSILNSKTFISFFNNEYAGNIIDLVYFNSCYSLMIATQVRTTPKTDIVFNHVIGYEKDNDAILAIEFAELFYRKFAKTNDFAASFLYSNKLFSVSLTTAKNNYSREIYYL